jgi:hypothetical protein
MRLTYGIFKEVDMKKGKKLSIFALVFLAIATTLIGIGCISGCGGGGGGGGGGGDCDIPCLTNDWGSKYYEFEDQQGNPIIVISYGDVHAEAGFNDDGDLIAFGGFVSDCYNGDIDEGAIDYNPPDGNIDYWFTSISGNVNISNKTLTISNLVIEGTPEADTVATCVGSGIAAISMEIQIDRKIQTEILFEILDKMSSE